MGEPLTYREQFALRSGLGKLIWAGRISSSDALYGDSISAQAV